MSNGGMYRYGSAKNVGRWRTGTITIRRPLHEDMQQGREEGGRAGVKRRTGDESGRRDSMERVSETHHRAEEAQERAMHPDATGHDRAEAQRLRHQANLAHVEHADRYDPLEAHEAAEAGAARHTWGQMPITKAAEPKMGVAEPQMFQHPGPNGFYKTAAPAALSKPSAKGLEPLPGQSFGWKGPLPGHGAPRVPMQRTAATTRPGAAA